MPSRQKAARSALTDWVRDHSEALQAEADAELAWHDTLAYQLEVHLDQYANAVRDQVLSDLLHEVSVYDERLAALKAVQGRMALDHVQELLHARYTGERWGD